MKRVKFTIIDKKWSITSLSKKSYEKKHGDDSRAITIIEDRKIDLSPIGCDKETIIHELVHAYWYEICAHSADLEDDQAEEIFAELMSKFGRELLDLADKLQEEIVT